MFKVLRTFLNIFMVFTTAHSTLSYLPDKWQCLQKRKSSQGYRQTEIFTQRCESLVTLNLISLGQRPSRGNFISSVKLRKIYDEA